jgi:hypothetical protein
MLRLIATGNSLPYSVPVDPSAEFEPGCVGQLTVIGNQVLGTLSNGTAPFGIIDDIKTKAFTAVSWDETVIALVNPAQQQSGPNNTIITNCDIKVELNNPNVLGDSFVSIPVDVQLKERNGVVIFPIGTILNYDLLGTGVPNAIKTNVRYMYQIPNIIGDDSTSASRRMTIWFQRMLLSTDRYETNQVYPINANLFVSEIGLFTTRQPAPNYPAIGIVISPPTPILGFLDLMWL